MQQHFQAFNFVLEELSLLVKQGSDDDKLTASHASIILEAQQKAARAVTLKYCIATTCMLCVTRPYIFPFLWELVKIEPNSW